MYQLERLGYETLVVAGSAVFAYSFVSWAIGSVVRQRKKWRRNPYLVAVQVALAAALVHVGFEVSGLNEDYCAQRGAFVS